MKAKISKITIATPIITILLLTVIFNSIIKSDSNITSELENDLYTVLGIIAICGIICVINNIIVILTTHLSFDSKNIYGKTGVINIKSLESPLNKINDIEVRKDLYGLLFKYGTIIIHTSSSKYVFRFIVNPEEFRTKLLNKINKD